MYGAIKRAEKSLNRSNTLLRWGQIFPPIAIFTKRHNHLAQ
ncbi:Unknown protein sequence [Pseudomonas syringae pv. maculicola]|nr:Unknown protein sequence [Pseudomonas syringae pv. maculicola]